MKNLSYILLLVLLVFSSCSKVKKTQKKLTGTWEIISYKTTNTSGLAHFYETSGTITFEETSDSTFSYVEDYEFDLNSNTIEMNRVGVGTFINENGLDYRLDINQPLTSTLNSCTIKLITKNDLKLEQRDNQFTHTIVLRKD